MKIEFFIFGVMVAVQVRGKHQPMQTGFWIGREITQGEWCGIAFVPRVGLVREWAEVE